MSESVRHEVYAVKFGENPLGLRGRFFYGSAREPFEEKVDLNYYVWLIRGAEGDIVLDTGFTEATARARGRDFHREPWAALELLGVQPQRVKTVILSHLHYDHTGGMRAFPEAEFIVQQAELDFWFGPYGRRGEFAHSALEEDLDLLRELQSQGRVRAVAGDHEVVPGVQVHLVGGHTPGSQATRVQVDGGQVVLAADASHFYENIEQDVPFAVLSDLAGVYRAFDRMQELATGDPVVPGHDPRVLARFAAVPGLEGIAARIGVANGEHPNATGGEIDNC